MQHTIKLALAVATLLTSISLFGFSIYGLVIHQWLLFSVCLLLTAGFGYFNYIDFKSIFGKSQ